LPHPLQFFNVIVMLLKSRIFTSSCYDFIGILHVVTYCFTFFFNSLNIVSIGFLSILFSLQESL
jgi:hypothetical protein